MNWLITGCSTGFGKELAKYAAERGDKVVGTLRKESQFADFEAMVPGQLKAILVDVTKPDQVAKGVENALAWMENVDILVNNAGYGSIGAVEAISRDEMIRQFDVNVFGAVEMVKAVLPNMRANKKGHILNITSIAGLRGTGGLGIYNGSKFALEGIGEALARELKPFNVRVTNVEPGPFRTDWAGRSATFSETGIEGYEESAGRFATYLKDVSGQQAGDPIKAAAAMYELVQLERPPVHLPLGAWANKGAKDKAEQLLQEVKEFEYLGLPTDYE